METLSNETKLFADLGSEIANESMENQPGSVQHKNDQYPLL